MQKDLLLCLFVFLSLASLGYSLNPVIILPGYALCNITVTISGAEIVGCPTSGSFDIYWKYQTPANISEDCLVKYLRLNYDESTKKFTNQKGVTLSVAGRNIGDASSLHPLYNDLINSLKAKGYTVGTDDSTLRGICYDWRALPYADVTNGGMDSPSFMDLIENLVIDSYTAAGNQKVYLIGHSNGPIYGHYFLTKKDKAFKDKYIAGSITLSGNFAGQGLGSVAPLIGFTVQDFSFQTTWTQGSVTFPSSYMSMAQPDIFSGKNELTILVVTSTQKNYTTQMYDTLYTDANNTFALNHWREWSGVVSPNSLPRGGGVRVHSFFGADLDTAVGVIVDKLPIDSFAGDASQFLLAKGDANQEYIDNESVLSWANTMPAGCFSHTEVSGVDHFNQCANADVIQEINNILSGPVSTIDCSVEAAPSSSTITGASIILLFTFLSFLVFFI